MLTLHYAPKTISVATAIVLEHIGQPYRAIRVDFAANQQQDASYLRINPKGRVPTLETPAGILTETPAILEYVAPQMVPDDPFDAARMRELMAYLNGTMHPHHAHKLRGNRWAREESSCADMRAMVPVRMAECAAYVDALLPKLPYDAGAMAVVADAYLFVVLSWLEGDGVDPTRFANVMAFRARMLAHPAIKAVFEKGML